MRESERVSSTCVTKALVRDDTARSLQSSQLAMFVRLARVGHNNNPCNLLLDLALMSAQLLMQCHSLEGKQRQLIVVMIRLTNQPTTTIAAGRALSCIEHRVEP